MLKFTNTQVGKTQIFCCLGTTCDFENGYCGWFSPVGYIANFTRVTGKKSSFGSLRKDHTTVTEDGEFILCLFARN